MNPDQLPEVTATSILESAATKARLEPAQVDAVHWYLQGLRGGAIGRAMGTSEGAGRKACSEGLKALREYPWAEGERVVVRAALLALETGEECGLQAIIEAQANHFEGSSQTPIYTSDNPLLAKLANPHVVLVTPGDMMAVPWRVGTSGWLHGPARHRELDGQNRRPTPPPPPEC